MTQEAAAIMIQKMRRANVARREVTEMQWHAESHGSDDAPPEGAVPTAGHVNVNEGSRTGNASGPSSSSDASGNHHGTRAHGIHSGHQPAQHERTHLANGTQGHLHSVHNQPSSGGHRARIGQ